MIGLLAFKYLVYLFQRKSFRLDPVSELGCQTHVQGGNNTHDKEERHNVPASIDNVHPPADVGEADRHHINQDETTTVSGILVL